MLSHNSLSDVYAPTFEMAVGGKRLPPSIGKSILEVTVSEVLNQPSSFSVRLNDPTLDLINQQRGLLTEGTPVAISIGYIGDTQKMIVAEIAAMTADFPDSGPATLLVEGFDLLHTATRGTAYRLFQDGMSDSAIVAEIAQRDMKLTASVDPTKPRVGGRIQNNISNFRFLEYLSQYNGYCLWVEDKTLHFQKKRPGPPLQLEWHKTLSSFSPTFSTVAQVKTVEYRGWDAVRKESVSGRAELSAAATSALATTGRQQLDQGAAGRSERVIPGDGDATSAEEAQGLAEAILAEQQRGLITGSGTSVGNSRIRVGTILDLKGIGRFSGRYMVERATHRVSEAGYHTSFEARQQL